MDLNPFSENLNTGALDVANLVVDTVARLFALSVGGWVFGYSSSDNTVNALSYLCHRFVGSGSPLSADCVICLSVSLPVGLSMS